MRRSNDCANDELTAPADIKRKASEDLTSPSASKRVKHDASAEPQDAIKPALKPIPFPEKVRRLSPPTMNLSCRL